MTTPQPPQGPPYQLPPVGAQPPQPQPKKTSRKIWIIIGAILAVFVAMVLLLGACVATLSNIGASTSPTVTSVDDSSVEPTTENSSSAPASPRPNQKANIDKSDIKLHVKTLSKKCYGSGIGCNIEYRVMVDGAYMDDWPKHGEVEVSYKVIGLEDGPETDSFIIDLEDGQYDKPWEEYSSTRSRSAKLSVKVTDVEYSK